MIEARYRRDYTGEFVIVNTDIHLGIKQQRREWIPNPIVNQHSSNRAAVIVGDQDRDKFDYAKLQRHRGGLRGSLRLQTYGVGNVWRHMRLDFYCADQRAVIIELAGTDYPDSTTIYTSVRFCLMFPGRFYTVPYQPQVGDIARMLYLAAFDGHEEIYVLGLNNDTLPGPAKWLADVLEVMTAYDQHEFFLVGVRSNMPDALLDLPNVNTLDYRQFITRCDI